MATRRSARSRARKAKPPEEPRERKRSEELLPYDQVALSEGQRGATGGSVSDSP
jgi:hypothetical protein